MARFERADRLSAKKGANSQCVRVEKIGIDETVTAFLVETGRRTRHPYGDFDGVQRAVSLELLSDVLASAFPDLSYGNHAAQKHCRARHCAR